LEVTAEPPIHKSYSLAADIDLFPNHDWVQIAEHDHEVVGVAALTIEAWNQRAVLRHLYVTSAARGIGVGHALVTAAIGFARDRRARCIWVETQTINYRAVQFYRNMDFAWCGFDTSLYDPNDDEVALFFSRELR
jgi:GNAT superfamily N-acetyltransferase